MKRTIIATLVLLLSFTGAFAQKNGTKAEYTMTYRQLGKTDLRVSELGLGCGAFGKMNQEEARQYMDVAMANGMNYIDIYDSDPTVRSNIGYALKNRRKDMVIQGHIGSYWKDGQYARTRDLAETKAGFEDLLFRLGTDYIEVGMIHICDKPEEWTSLEGSEFLAYVFDLKKQGKIKYIGMSSHNPEVALMAAKSGWIDVIMFSLNPAFDRPCTSSPDWKAENFNFKQDGIDPIRMELYDYCAMNRIGISVMKVFGGGGRLLAADKSPLGIALTPVQCLAYSLSKPCVSTALCGADNIEELMSDLAYLSATEQQKDYNSVLNGSKTINAKTGTCTYCKHCSPCPVGIDIAKVNQLLDEFNRTKKITKEMQAEYDALPHKASECIRCGKCESRCPFSVPVQEQMIDAEEMFERR